MSLKTSEVYRCLDKKTEIFGFEIVDLFVVFVCLAILNLVFGHIAYKFFWTWGPTVGLAAFLRISKAGKPENHLLHLARHLFTPTVFSAFPLVLERKLASSQFVDKPKGFP